MGCILFHDYKSKADTLKIKVDLVCLIQRTTLLQEERMSCRTLNLRFGV